MCQPPSTTGTILSYWSQAGSRVLGRIWDLTLDSVTDVQAPVHFLDSPFWSVGLMVSLQSGWDVPMNETVLAQSLRHVGLRDPRDCGSPGSSALHYLPESLRFLSTESVMWSNHLIFCCPVLLLPSIFPNGGMGLGTHLKAPCGWKPDFIPMFKDNFWLACSGLTDC